MTTSDKEKIRLQIRNTFYLSTVITIGLFIIALLIAINTTNFEMTFFMFTLISILLGMSYFFIKTKSLNKDLKIGKIKTKSQIVTNKYFKSYHVPSNASQVDSYLISLSKNLLLTKVNTVNKYYAKTECYNLEISKTEFDQINIGQTINIRCGYYSDLFLGMGKNNYA